MTKTNKPQVKIVNCETGEEIIRDANAEEIAQMQLNAANTISEKAEAEAKAAQRQAILDRLGLTSEEAALLLS
jgi:cobalamin biosynthesis protein CbiD